MINILYAVIVLGVLGAVFGLLLAFASRVFAVPVDERKSAISEILPGANCGGCGFAGCSAFANAVVEGNAPVSGCVVGGAAVSGQIAKIMGVDVEESIRNVAFVHCSGNHTNSPAKYFYVGVEDCVAALKLQSGPSACQYSCLGMGNCTRACKFDAIHVVDGVAVVDKEKCTGCKACVSACPREIIKIIPYDSKTVVPCNSKDKGPDTRKVCLVGCISCHICEKICQYGAIKVVDNHAVIDYDKCTSCGECIEKCPRGIINVH